MSATLDEFIESLASFRPLGELRYVERVLFELSERAREDIALWHWLKTDVHAVLQQAGIPESTAARVVVHLATDDERHLVIPADPADEGPEDEFQNLRIRAAEEPAFRRRLLTETRSALQEMCPSLSRTATVQVHENTVNELHLVLAAEAALREEDLERVAGGLAMPLPRTWPWDRHGFSTPDKPG